MAVSQKTVIANALEPRRQSVLQEEADELFGGDGHHLANRVAVVGPGKRDLAVLKGQEALIADGDAVGIAAEILQHARRSAEGGLGVHDPVFMFQGSQEAGEGDRIAQRRQVPKQLEFAIGVGLGQSLYHQAAKTAREDFDRQEESALGGDPTLVVGRQTAAGNDAVQVRMEVQVLAPAMEDAKENEFQSQPLGCDGEQGLGGGAKQNVVDDWFVVESEGGDRLGDGEDDMEIPGGQQFGSAILQPVFTGDALALGAMAVAAGTVANVSELAVVAHFDDAAQPRRTAGFDGLHQAVLMQG